MPPNSIEAIAERVRGALTGPCGERELKDHALDDLEWLLDAYEKQAEEHASATAELEFALTESEISEESALRDVDKSEKRAELAEAEAKRLLRLLRLLSPPIDPVAS